MHNPTQYYFSGSCWSEFKQKFPTIYMFDWLIWPPSQGVNFLYVPSKYRYIRTLNVKYKCLHILCRVLYVNGVTVVWDVFLSYIKHKPEDEADLERENIIKSGSQL